jgi:hypothetical protein
MNIEDAFMMLVNSHPNRKTAHEWKKRIAKGTLKQETMRQYLLEAGWKKTQSEQWEK